MLIETAPTLQTEEETVMALACVLYEQGARAESFRLLLRLSAAGNRTAPLFYNQALCLEQAGQREKAISCLEKALSCLKSGKRELEKPSGEAEVLRILYERQCAQAQYRFPMREAEAVCLPAYARERILRLMIDLCAQLNDGARVRTLVASLQGKRFENVEKALRQISEKET
ncbi:hypothetical protein [Flavonifractor sp. An306]|uniref:hypothetical protein n=1 Tax=Flavonifractor sp. An306 TaxID=1965629 RepID=UPI000B386B21|nr:hypothetical protein [Flavonifractor sp. An306]OUO44598.1 hypothetical protein B5F88_00635 [Flavonifractor sp. An306]